MPVLNCGHETSEAAHRICCHLLEANGGDYWQHFTGNGLDFDLVCGQCQTDPRDQLRTACPTCFEQLQSRPEGFSGQPEVLKRESSLRFEHGPSILVPGLYDQLLDIQPIHSMDRNLWIGVTLAGKVIQLDLDGTLATPVGELGASSVDLSEPISLHLSRDGKMAAVVNTRGRYGIVLDLVAGKRTMDLDRDDYHNEHCNFPVAFFDHEGQTVLIHGTAWNRLDVSDPRSGRPITERPPTSYRRGEPQPDHYLDYFHCALSVSPDQQYVSDNGWVWAPVGVIATWSLKRWLRETVWESEDGASKKYLCDRSYYWDGPTCWIGNRKLAVWGYGDDDNNLIPAVRLFDVVTGSEERWFAGPKGNLFFDGFLFSCDGTEGTSVWDVNTGQRLHREPGFCPIRYHQGIKAFLTVLPGGEFRISKLRGKTVDPSWLLWHDRIVEQIAHVIAAEQRYQELPILHDALIEAGCTDEDILAHCRAPGPHANSCWVVDLLLGK